MGSYDKRVIIHLPCIGRINGSKFSGWLHINECVFYDAEVLVELFLAEFLSVYLRSESFSVIMLFNCLISSSENSSF